MADIEPPSFSLGLDLDFDFEPSHNPPPVNPATHQTSVAIGPQQKGKEKVNELEDVEFELRVSDSEPDSPEISPPNRFRRLRRGVPSSYKPISTPISNSLDDDIEDFSDEEIARTNDLVAPQHHSSCSSSKLPLSGSGVLMRQQESTKHNNSKGKQDSSCPSTSLGSSKGKKSFPNLTSSPLRRFQLLDSESDPDHPSDVRTKREAIGVGLPNNNKQKEYNIQAEFKLLDSESDPDDPSDVHNDRDASSVKFSKNNNHEEYNIRERFKLLGSESDSSDPSDGEHIGRESSVVDLSKNNKQEGSNHGSHTMSLGKKADLPPPISQQQDLWKDFCASDKFSVKTPAFDEFLTEYFQSAKSTKPAPGPHKLCSNEQDISMNSGNKIFQNQISGSVPPSHLYFFNNDLRIQRLVQSRLPHFCPLTGTDAGSKSHNVSSINYMSQFGQDGGKRQTGRQVTLEKSSKRGRKKSKNSGVEGTSHGSGDWINPKQTANTPKDAGRRRVQASGQSAGQSAGRWLVAENGRKVYINKNGQELTGQIAYRQYRKESGRSFKKSKKKVAAKK